MTPEHTHLPGVREHRGRGLCRVCYWRSRYDGTLADYERRTRTRQEVLEDWALLRSEGYSRRDAAARMGMTDEALRKALARARVAA